MGGQAYDQFNCGRIQRFFVQVRWCYLMLVPLILKWRNVKGPVTLIIVRTNWSLCSSDLNILYITVLCFGFCVPLIWTLLPKEGNSSQKERIDLINKLINVPWLPKIKLIIGDREFIGSTWFEHLKDNHIGILIRLKENQMVKRYNNYVSVSGIIKGNTRRGTQCNGKQYWMDQVQIYIFGFRYNNADNKIENMIITSFKKHTKISSEYSKCWYI